ncbi:MAG: DMT family transporter [Euryarchaeota archaeon]|nr:DMT family transporter [Euryarchaeota archaeon]
MRIERNGIVLIVVSAVSFGGVAVLSKLVLEGGLDVLCLLFWRWLIAGLAVAPLVLFGRGKKLRRRTIAYAFALGAVGQYGTSGVYTESLRYLPAAIASFLLFLSPVFVAAFSAILFGETLTRRGLAALALSVLGLALMAFAPGGEAPIVGVVLGLASALLYASTIVAGRRIIGSGDGLSVAWFLMLGATTMFAATALASGGLHGPTSASVWSELVVLGVVSTALSIGTFYVGLPLVGAPKAALVSTLEPVSTLILAFLVLGENLTIAQYAGAGLILAAVAIVATEKKGAPPGPPIP